MSPSTSLRTGSANTSGPERAKRVEGGPLNEAKGGRETKRLKLFAGLTLTDGVRAKCAAIVQRLERANFEARFESPEKMHVTLAFLGWIEPERLDAIAAALALAASQSAPFELTLDKIGAFPHERRPRVVWIGSRGTSPHFRKLANAVRDACAQLGFAFEKEAVAHVTIARVKGGRAHLPVLRTQPVKLPVSALTLFESLPSAGTTRYEVRARFDLKPNA